MERTTRKLLMLISFLALLLVAVSCVPAPASGGASRWDRPVSGIEDALNRAAAAYEKGDREAATQLAKDAYFEVFESSGMETAIRLNISSRRAFDVEQGFTRVRQLLRMEASPAEVRQGVSRVMALLREDAARLGGNGEISPTADFLASFLIIVREGFEAILIIAAIIAYLVKSGNDAKVRTIYQSALFALLASIATAIAVRFVFNISGASQEFLEGATMLLATAVLFSVSFWLLGKVQAQRWQQYIQSKLERSLTTGSALALWSATFLAVYREGAETVLFYQALIAGAEGESLGAIGLGFAAGVVVLAAIFVAISWGSVRIPIKPFFVGTGAFLYYMAFVFAGQGVRELQEAGAIGVTLAPGVSDVDLLGIYPTWEGIALQSALVLAAVVGLAYQFLFKPRSSSATGRATT
ncbi:MAG: FTR1 family iron permease [Chloroflexi bacterium]|nr:FTR1 family iron permease [Chloroflexota bacterium]